MSRRLVYLVLMASGYSLCAVQAEEWNRAAYWDGAHWTNWMSEDNSVALRDELSAAGYQILDAGQLKTWMDARIADGALSVVVFCRDNGPDTVVETVDENCTLRRYLNAGGKIVWPSDIPFYNITHSDGTYTNYGISGSTAVLGFYAANGQWDSGNTVTVTEIGAVWGLTKTWTSVRAAVKASVDITLATDSSGYATAWVKHYLPHDTFRGFVRIYDASSGRPDTQDVIRLAEYRESYHPYAIGTNPTNGAVLQESECTLAWKAGDSATSHNVYFTDDLAALNAGQVAPTSTTDTSLAVADLAVGKTYYWRVDEIADGNPASPWEGAVQSFTVQARIAWSPTPANGAVCVLLDQALSWNVGLGGLFHTVYFSENHDDVANGTVEGLPIGDPSFIPAALEAGKTYYWRIDELTPDGTGNLVTYPGDVWSFSTVPSAAIANPHLVGWWTFDEGASDIAVDSSGYGHHGTLSGGIERVEGVFGGALQFGDGTVVNCGTGAAEQVTGDFTLAAWVKLDHTNTGIYGGIGGRLHLATNYYGFALVRHNSNVFRLWVADGTSDLAKSAVGSNVTYTDTEWHHVAGVRSGQVNALYVDGELQSRTTNTSFVPSSEWFHIGRQYSSQADRTFPGRIDDFRVYDVASTAATIAQIMAGDENVAGDPEPASGAVLDIRDLPDLAWSAGATAASHDVYLGADFLAVADADHSAAEFRGSQTDTRFSVSDLVAFGGGDYHWRIDEVEADGVTIHEGYIWKLTLPAYVPVDDFESYTDDEAAGTAIFQTWTDGLTNGTNSYVGYDAATGATFGEIVVVRNGGQSMPLAYSNADLPYYSETERAWTTAQDWTAEGVNTLVLFVRGVITNDTGTLYVALQDSTNKVGVVAAPDVQIPTRGAWTRLRFPLADFGVKTTAIKKMYIGIGDRDNPTAGGAGRIYIDDICVVKQ